MSSDESTVKTKAAPLKFSVDSALMGKALRLFEPKDRDPYPVALTAEKTVGGAGSLSLLGMDGIKYLRVSISADVEEEGEWIFMSANLRCLKDTSEPRITAATRIASKGDTRLNVNGLWIPACIVARPEMPEGVPGGGSALFQMSELKGLFRRVVFATGGSEDPSLPYDCLCLDFEGYRLTAVCGDVMIFAKASIPKGSAYRGQFLLHKSCVDVLRRLDGDLIHLEMHEGKGVSFTMSGDLMVDLYVPKWSKKFPDYKRIFDVDPLTFLSGTKANLLAFLERAQTVSDEVTLIMKHVGYVKQPVRFSSHGLIGVDASFETDKLDWRGDDLKIKVNAKTMIQAIREVRGETATVSFTLDIGRITVSGEGDDYRAVMNPYMPGEKR